MKKFLFILSMSATLSALAVPLPALTNSAGDTNENGGSFIAPDFSAFFTQADAFFKKYVSEGRVDYAAIKSDPTELHSLIDIIAKTDLSDAEKNTKIAFYLNAYNLYVINNIVDNMPISSPLDVKGFFDTKKVTVAGESITLNDLEGKKLRPDPRVHFALVCAAKGCPKIMSGAYFPDKVQAQLNNQTKKAMDDTSFIKVDAGAQKVSVSKIFEWYKDDFVNNSGDVISFINKYRSSAIPATYTMDTYDYNWELNKK